MNACAACLTDQIDQQGLLVRPRLGRERESLEAATFPVGGHGGSSSGPLLRLRASGARVCVRLEDCVRAKRKRPIFCRLHCSVQKSVPWPLLQLPALVLVSPIRTNAETRAPTVLWIFLHIKNSGRGPDNKCVEVESSTCGAGD
jgi:hypothetical protein